LLLPQQQGRKAALDKLVNYACIKMNAIDCRKNLKWIEWALDYEAKCERIYRELPSFARW
jgi:hypothetical protein